MSKTEVKDVTIEKAPCGEREALVDYLYGESGRDDRARFEAHLALCAECRDGLEALRGVRSELASWEVPADAGAAAGVLGAIETKNAGPAGGFTRPWWAPGAFAAAAVIALAAAAATANLEITYGQSGVSVRTGWSRVPAATPTAQAPVTSVSSEGGASPRGIGDITPVAVPDAAASPWREELSALERRLRTELQASAGSRAQPLSADSARLLQRVQELIEQSEMRQRRELALRMAQVVRDFDAQRQTDLVRIQQGLGQIEGNTAADRQILNYLVRASQRQ
jgi:hypothetical protein